jgi:hypothetical protein
MEVTRRVKEKGSPTWSWYRHQKAPVLVVIEEQDYLRSLYQRKLKIHSQQLRR